jgi:hypothetical protein
MACNSIDARLEPCKEYVGGIQGVFFIPFVWSDIVNVVSGTGNIGAVSSITDSAATNVTGHFWELKGPSTFEVAVTSDRNGGTTMYEGTLSMTWKPKAQDGFINDFDDLNTLAKGRWRIVVWDRNDNFWLLGEEYGADVTTGAESWGANLGDPRTYNLSFISTEANPPRPLDASSYADLSSIFTVDATPA